MTVRAAAPFCGRLTYDDRRSELSKTAGATRRAMGVPEAQ
jgi:hypothetical protein